MIAPSLRVRETVFGAGMRFRFQNHLDRLELPPGPAPDVPVTEDEIDDLPEPARRFLRFRGVVGRPRDWSFRVRFAGRFRLGRNRPNPAWMPCDAWQYDTAIETARVFYMRILFTRVVPMFAIDSYVRGHGRMLGKMLGVFPLADGSGPEFDIGELTTYLNDALLLAPSMLLRPSVRWTPATRNSFDISITDAGVSARARAFVDSSGRLLDFSSTDRWAALPSGLTCARWTTPIDGWAQRSDGRWLPTGGAAIWHLPDGDFEYVRGRFLPYTFVANVGPVTSAHLPGPSSMRRLEDASIVRPGA